MWSQLASDHYKKCLTLIWIGLLFWSAVPSWSQGQVIFANHISGGQDAPVLFAWDSLDGPGAGYTAQLFFAPPGTAQTSLQPLFPTTTFRTDSLLAERYVHRVIVEVPGFLPGEFVDMQFRAFNGKDWENSTIRGASRVFTQYLGGGDFPPSNLAGLDYEPILLNAIPEPAPLPLASLGAVALTLYFLRRKSRGVP